MEQELKKTTQILIAFVQNSGELTRKNLSDLTELTIREVSDALRFLIDLKIVLVRYIKVKERPFRRALYKINPEKAEDVARILMRDGVVF